MNYIIPFLLIIISVVSLTALDESSDSFLDRVFDSLPDYVKNKKISTNESYLTFFEHYKCLKENEELLILVNKQNTLSPDYTPVDLIETKDIIPSTKDSCLLRSIILPDLIDMYNDAKKVDINLVIVSGYRSYEKQIKTYEYWVNAVGKEAASKISAIAGASQHQLGTAIDFNSLENSFASTPEGKWLLNNSYKYGFILSYPEGCEEITGYSYEPWHYRYIGKNAAYITYTYFDNILELFLKWYWKKIADK